jgi:glycosyltransferase involved in cell wall biosynthesis
MKILIDGYWWNEGPLSNRMVLLEIVKHWLHYFPDDELIVAAAPCKHLKLFRADSADNLKADNLKIVRTHLRYHPAINLIELPLIARRENVDIILAFAFAPASKRAVVFLHDVLFQSNPEWFTLAERIYFSAIPLLARRARSVITTSASERKRIVAYNSTLARVNHCGLALSSSLQDAAMQRPMGLSLTTGSFVMCVGRFNVRKNLETTVRAIQQTGLLSKAFPLLLVGEPSGVPVDLSEFVKDLANQSIVTVQNLTDGELKWLYANCRVFVCLSLDEGYGLPVVEAATFGAPVLASDIPVFRETLGEYGTFVSPTDTDAVRDAARRMIMDRHDNALYIGVHSWRSVCQNIRYELDRVASSDAV